MSDQQSQVDKLTSDVTALGKAVGRVGQSWQAGIDEIKGLLQPHPQALADISAPLAQIETATEELNKLVTEGFPQAAASAGTAAGPPSGTVQSGTTATAGTSGPTSSTPSSPPSSIGGTSGAAPGSQSNSTGAGSSVASGSTPATSASNPPTAGSGPAGSPSGSSASPEPVHAPEPPATTGVVTTGRP